MGGYAAEVVLRTSQNYLSKYTLSRFSCQRVLRGCEAGSEIPAVLRLAAQTERDRSGSDGQFVYTSIRRLAAYRHSGRHRRDQGSRRRSQEVRLTFGIGTHSGRQRCRPFRIERVARRRGRRRPQIFMAASLLIPRQYREKTRRLRMKPMASARLAY